MKNNVNFTSVSDRELLTNTCLSLLSMSRRCNDDDYKYFIRKAYINLNALVECMILEGDSSVTF